MRRPILVLFGLFVLGGLAWAQERTDLTTPITKASTTNYRLQSILLEPIAGRITVDLLADTGDHVVKVYNQDTTPTGATLLSTLNISNNSAGTSLIRRVYTRLITDGVIVGTVSGTPQ